MGGITLLCTKMREVDGKSVCVCVAHDLMGNQALLKVARRRWGGDHKSYYVHIDYSNWCSNRYITSQEALWYDTTAKLNKKHNTKSPEPENDDTWRKRRQLNDKYRCPMTRIVHLHLHLSILSYLIH